MHSSLVITLSLLPLCINAASPSQTTPPAETSFQTITSQPLITARPLRRDDFTLSLPPLSLDIPTIPTLSLDLPVETCTPGFSSYATPGPDGYVPPEACNALWLYSPNLAAAVVFSVLFGALTIAHLSQAILYRNGFCWVVIMAALWETGAYVFRALGSKNQQSAGIAIVAQILVLVAPIWVNAFAYMVFARMVHFYSPTRRVWIFSPSSLAAIFVTLDLVSFVIQLVGGGMAGPGANSEAQQRGLNIYMGGIGMQEGFIVLFTGLVVKFHRDQLQATRAGRISIAKSAGWKCLIWTLYLCLLAITIRIIYRLVEFSAGLGTSNPLPGNEPVLYVLESVPMFLAILMWNLVHPGRYIRGEDAKMPHSWLSRHLYCCCHGRRKMICARGSHRRLVDNSEEEQELRPVIKDSHVLAPS